MPKRTVASLALLATFILPATGADPALVAVDVGQSGTTRYVWDAVPEGGTVRLTVPETDASDVLASLVVVSGAGGTLGVTTSTPTTPGEALRGGRFASVPRSVEETVEALEGLEVTLDADGGPVTGEVMGVVDRTVPVGDVEVDIPVVLLATDRGLREVVLDLGTTIVLPEGARADLDGALLAEARGAGARTFAIALANPGPDVRLGYVTAGPA